MNNLKEKKNKSCAVIPFYNEFKTLKKVIIGTLNHVDKVIAVNDGSTDGSEDLSFENDKVLIIGSRSNRGKGYALRTGFGEALELGYEYVVTLDADLQHDPEFIPLLLEELDQYDFVIGNRLNNLNDMPFHRILSNKLTSFLLTLKTGQTIADSQCGFRAFKSKILRSIKIKFNGFEAESEMIVLAARHKMKIGYVDVPTIYGDTDSKMNSMKTITGFIRTILL